MFGQIKYAMFIVASALLVACGGPSPEDAKKLGFDSVVEMKEIQAKGFPNKTLYINAENQRIEAEDKAKSISDAKKLFDVWQVRGWIHCSYFLEYYSQYKSLSANVDKLVFESNSRDEFVLKAQRNKWKGRSDNVRDSFCSNSIKSVVGY